MTKNSRRQFLTQTVPLTIGATMGITQASAMGSITATPSEKKKKVVVVGAHPDDPETICGGLMALYANAGHEVVSAYLTRGEAGIEGKSHEEAAKIRTAEALTACKILKCRAEFLGQIDGNTEITKEKYAPISDFLKRENPDIIVTHWPIDTHRDHRICSNLVYDAWLRMNPKPTLYFGEAMTGAQSQNFTPTDYIDITSVIQQKHQACYAHVSQKVDEWYPNDHARMEVFRGMEFGCEYAEAFVRYVKSPENNLNEIG